MKKLFAILVFAAFPFASAFADTPVAVVAPVETTDEIKREFSGQIETIHELFSGALANTRIIKMVARTESAMKGILTEHDFQEGSWSDNTKTAALGKALNATIIIRIRIDPIRNRYVLIATALNLQTLEQIAMERKSIDDIEDIILEKEIIEDFAGGIAKKIAGDSVVQTNTTAAAFTIPDDFVLIKGGRFDIGSLIEEKGRGGDESPNPHITISDFYMCKYEVNQDEYTRIMGKNPSKFQGKNLPVESVTWYAAIEYCNKRSEVEGLTPVYRIKKGNGQEVEVEWRKNASGYRLPTEAEWEYACRAKTTTPYNTGTSISTEDANYDGSYTVEQWFIFSYTETKGTFRQKTVPVDSFRPNKYNLYNMHGNVAEWCWDY
jgi:formylglycine-generating enzyme required for sulfatase activity